MKIPKSNPWPEILDAHAENTPKIFRKYQSNTPEKQISARSFFSGVLGVFIIILGRVLLVTTHSWSYDPAGLLQCTKTADPQIRKNGGGLVFCLPFCLLERQNQHILAVLRQKKGKGKLVVVEKCTFSQVLSKTLPKM